MVGLLDWFTGGGQYADPNAIDPRYGVPMSDVRQAGINTLANISAALLAAGQGGLEPGQRAAYLAQLGQAAGGMNTDIYNAAQRRLMQTQMEEKRAEAQAVSQFGELMKDPERFKASTGFDVREFAGMPPREAVNLLRQVQAQRLARDPMQAAATALTIQKTQRELATPRTQQVGNNLYEYDEASKKWNLVASGPPQGGLEGGAQEIILQGMRNPAIAETPEYSVAFNRLFAPRVEIRNGEVVQIVPEVPVGVPRPRGAAPAAGVVAPPAAAAPMTEAPTAPLVPAAPPAAAAPAPSGGETRTVTTPGGGSVSITSTQPRALSPAELALRAEEEKTFEGLQSAQEALKDALRLSPQAFAGPLATRRGAIAGALGADSEAAVATRQFNSIMTEQVLSQLRSVFGANPTEGERKILLDMQAGADMSRPEREALLNRAIAAVEKRLKSTERRLGEITRGEFSRVQPGYSAPAAPSAPPAPPPGFQVVR